MLKVILMEIGLFLIKSILFVTFFLQAKVDYAQKKPYFNRSLIFLFLKLRAYDTLP